MESFSKIANSVDKELAIKELEIYIEYMENAPVSKK